MPSLKKIFQHLNVHWLSWNRFISIWSKVFSIVERKAKRNVFHLVRNRIPESPYRYLLLGLNLLCLLAQNRLADFHTVRFDRVFPLNSSFHLGIGITFTKRHSNESVFKTSGFTRTISDGRQLQQGSFSLDFHWKKNSSLCLGFSRQRQRSVTSFYFFYGYSSQYDSVKRIRIDFSTDRFYFRFSDEIAFCMEKSYRKISLNEAARILYLNKAEEVKEIATKVKKNKTTKIVTFRLILLARLEITFGSSVSFLW